MRARRTAALLYLSLLLSSSLGNLADAGGAEAPLPAAAEGWRVTLVKQAPEIVFPTAVVSAPDGTLYLGQDPMDMPGPPTVPADSVVAIRGDGKVTVFADKLWAVMGLEWADDTLFVVHAPFLSAFRDTDGDGKADRRVDLVTGLGPKLPGFSGINDHVASGLRLGMDGFLYIAVGDKGIPRGVGKDGATVRLFGGGVIRVRPDGTGLEVVSTGERNPLSVALTATDEVFTYGNDDDSKRWPNSLTHHVVGGHYGYPYQFLNAPFRALPVTAGEIGGSGTQAICYNEDGLPGAYRGNLIVCDWGLQTVFRYALKKSGATFEVASRSALVTKGGVNDFRPFSVCVAGDRKSLYVVDWGFDGWLTSGVQTGRLYRLTYEGPDRVEPAPGFTSSKPNALLDALDHPARSVRIEAQRRLASTARSKDGSPLVAKAIARRLKEPGSDEGRRHALWALDAIGGDAATRAIAGVIRDENAGLRLQAVRSLGVRRDAGSKGQIENLLGDHEPAVRREAAIALGRIGKRDAGPRLMAALGDVDPFVSWSVRRAIRALGAWDVPCLTASLLDPRTREDALRLCDESWAAPVVEALSAAAPKLEPAEDRARAVTALAGLYRRYPEWSGNWFGTNPLAGTFPQKTETWDETAAARIRSSLGAAVKDASPVVRLKAIGGLIVAGKPAVPTLRSALATETDPGNLAALAQGLGVLGDFASAPTLGAIVQDESKPEPVRLAALDALGVLRGPQALTARIAVVYDPKSPASLVTRALPTLGREGIIPANDLAGFLVHSDPAIRAAALNALKTVRKLPDDVRQSVVSRLDDPSPEVREAAADAVAARGMREAVPGLLAAALNEGTKEFAVRALVAMPDPQALPIYLDALSDRNPEVRRGAEFALLAIRDAAAVDLKKAARVRSFDGPAANAMERVLTRLRPVTRWKVIGPFARTTARVFIGEPSIDFSRPHSGAEGRTIAWADRPGHPETGRVVLNDFKAGAGDRGGFGYDTNGSPDLCAFGYAEVTSDRDRDALLAIGSSGTAVVTVNEQVVLNYRNGAGRAYQLDSDVVRVALKKGNNRILVMTRQGVGVWAFGVQVSEPPSVTLATGAGRKADPEAFRVFAMGHDGDAKGGEALFFDARGVGCAKCHSAGGKGTSTVGPDLTGLALKYDRAEIIRSVLEPSARVANGYQPVSLATRDGKVVTGLLKSETGDHIDLIDSEARLTRVAVSDVEERRLGDLSVMPAGLVDSLSVVEFADLISYLQSLKSTPQPAGGPDREN